MSGAKATVLRPWGVLTNASRAADGMHVVIVWRSPQATDIAPTKRLITRSRVQGWRASGRDASTPGGNPSTLATLRRRDMACYWALRVFVTVNGQDGGGCRATNLRFLSGYAIGTGMHHSSYTAHAELQNPHAVAQVSFCHPVLSTSRRLFAPMLIAIVRVTFV